MRCRSGVGRTVVAMLAAAAVLFAAGVALSHKGSVHLTTGTARIFTEQGGWLIQASIVDGGNGVYSGTLEVTRQICPPGPECVAQYRISCARIHVRLEPTRMSTHDVHAVATKVSGSNAFSPRYLLRIIDKKSGFDFFGIQTKQTYGPCGAEAARSPTVAANFHTAP